MKLIDIIFYLFWRALSMGSSYPLSVLNNPTFHKWTKVLFVFAVVLYWEDAAIYSSLNKMLNTSTELLLIAATVAVSILYFSKGKDSAVISYWGEKRANAKRLDAAIGWILFTLPFVLLFIKPKLSVV